MTEDQKEAIRDGASTKIVLVVSGSTAPEQDKNTVNNVIQKNSYKPVLMMDIELLCTVTKNNAQVGTAQNITETESEIIISVKVPDEYINKDGSIKREYHIVRLHYNESGVAETEVIPATFDSATKMLTFKTNKFSLYAITYKDTKVESEYVYIPSKNKKPVVNTFGLNISVTNGLEFNKDNTESAFNLLMDNNDFDGKVASVTVSGLELTSDKGDKVTMGVDYDHSVLYLAGEYPINVKVVDDEKKAGVYKGTLKVTVNYKEGLALVGGTVYQDLQEAFNDCASDSAVILLKDIALSSDLQIDTGSKNINLNLNNKTIDGGSYQVYTAGNGILTIYGDGVIKNNNTSQTADYAPLRIFSGSNVVLDGVSIEGLYCGVKNSGNLTVLKANIKADTFGIGLFGNGETIIGQNDSDNDITVLAEEQAIATASATGESDMVVNVYGGVFETTGTVWDDCPVYWASQGTLNVYGGTFKNITESVQAAGILQKNGTVNIVDGNFEAKDGIKIVAQEDSTEITTSIVGGNFTGTRSGIYIDASNSTHMGRLTEYGVTIENGNTIPTFTGGTEGAIYAKTGGLGSRTLMSIYGGAFSTYPTDYVVDALVKQNTNGTYTVTSLPTDENGDYLINNADDLILFEKIVNDGGFGFNGKKVRLSNDIDINNIEWNPIGQTGATQFQGVFDGQGHTISNMTVNNTDTSAYCASGFFGWVENTGNAVITNVKFDNANVTGNHNVGVVAGWVSGTISNCEIKNSTVTGINANDDANGDKIGGLVGYINAGIISENIVENCTIKSNRDAGGIVGAIAAGTTFANNSVKDTEVYYSEEKSYASAGAIVSGRTGFSPNETNTATNVTASKLVSVSNANELSAALNATYNSDAMILLTNDIALSDEWGAHVLNLGSNATVTIDGNEKTVSGLTTTTTTDVAGFQSNGLISGVNTPDYPNGPGSLIVKHLTIENATVSSSLASSLPTSAALIGSVNNTNINVEDVTVTGANVSSDFYAGGLIGYVQGNYYEDLLVNINNCEVRNSSFNGNDATGALIALNNEPTAINGASITGNAINGGNGYSASALVGTSIGGTTATNVTASDNTFSITNHTGYQVNNATYGYIYNYNQTYLVNGNEING